MGNSSSVADEKTRAEIRAIEERMKWEREEAAARIQREQQVADAIVKREQQEADARKEEAAARVKREQQEAAARVTAIETSSRINNINNAGLAIGLAGLAGILLIDYMIHGFNPYIKRCVKRSFLKMPPSVPTHNIIPLDASRLHFLRVVEDMGHDPNTPRVLLGPTGCGKSTLLKMAANMYYSNGLGPVKFISIRASENSTENSSNDKTRPIDDDTFKGNSEAFNNITQAILQGINYPIRRPIIEELFSSIKSLKVGDDVELIMQFKNQRNEDKLSKAFSMLVDCAVELRNERDKVPLIIFDEIHDLVRVNRFRDVGGLRTFRKLADMVVHHNVNNSNINFLFAGSSSILADSFKRYSHLNDNRTDYCYIEDYSPEVMEKYLCEKRLLSRENALHVINRVGTRLRIVKRVVSGLDLERGIDGYYSRARDSINEIAKNEECLRLLKALGQGRIVPSWSVPDKVKHLKGFSNVFYMDVDNLVFQNEVVRNIWMSEFHDPGKILSLPV